MRCVFLAFGTRGDVQPVAVLSTQYKARNPQALVTFITHAAHQARAARTWIRLSPFCRGALVVIGWRPNPL
jgi:hypothetical protein